MKWPNLALLLLVLVLFSLLAMQWEQLQTTRELASAVELNFVEHLGDGARNLPEDTTMSRSQTWRYYDANHTVQIITHTTVRGDAQHPNESKADFIARFNAEIAALEETYKPIDD